MAVCSRRFWYLAALAIAVEAIAIQLVYNRFPMLISSSAWKPSFS